MKKWDYVLWDWNGTIIDDFQYNLSIINSLLTQHSLPQITEIKYRELFTFPIKNFYEKLGFDCSSEEKFFELGQAYFAAYKNNQEIIHLAIGIERILSELYKAKVYQIIFSSCNKNILMCQLNNYPDISEYFSDIIAPDDVKAAGKMELVLKWGRTNHIDWNRVLIIGDTCHEQEIALHLGCDCVLLNCGHQKIKEAQFPVCQNLFQLFNMIVEFEKS